MKAWTLSEDGQISFNNCCAKLYPGRLVTLVKISINDNSYCFTNEHLTYSQEEIDKLRAGEDIPDKHLDFQGDEYGYRPFGISGISFSSDGRAGKPSIAVSNIDQRPAAMIRSYNGMKGAKVEIFLIASDDNNLDGKPYRRMIFYINRPSYHDNKLCEFECSSPFDLDGVQIPGRTLCSTCSWATMGLYRSGTGCDYNGTKYFDKNNNPVSDPALDACAGTVTACKLRHGNDNELPFGGAAVASLQSRFR